MFITDTDGDYRFYSGNTPHIATRLPAGVYAAAVTPNLTFFRPTTTQGDTIVNLDTPVARQVKREITSFFDVDITKRLADNGIKHRRGVLLHGAPGSGKTSLLRSFFPLLIERDAVIISECNADYLENHVIPAIRKDDPDRPIVLSWDEFEKNVSHSFSELLSLLDGMASPDHLLVLATTNHLDQIPDTMLKRPSRFGLILEMPPLDRNARIVYAGKKYPMLGANDREQLVDLVDPTCALDYIEEACKLFLMGYEHDEIRGRLNGVKQAVLVCYEDDEDEDE
jgi:hypothetical protein